MERARQSPADIRLALKAAGFSPVACFGKAPLLSEWQNRRDATPEEIAKWPGGNSGIDTKDAPGLDIDIDDAEAAACIEATARDWFDGRGTIPVRFGRAPRRALLFRAATPFAKIIAKFVAPNGTKHKIEFLGDGQQIIAHGIHPDTGTSYAWHADLAPWNMKRGDLVEIAEEEAHAFINHITDVLREQFGFEHAPTEGNGQDTQSPFGDGAAVAVGLEALDEASTEDAGGITNEVQCRIIPGQLRAGEHPGDLLERVVDETMTHAGNRLGWTRAEEVKCVARRILSAYRNLLLKDYDPASGTIPDWLPGDFHEAWLRVLSAGGHPMMHFNRGGFCIKSMQRTFPGSTRQNPEPEAAVEVPDAERGKPAKPDKPDKKQQQARGPIRAIPFVAFDEAKLPPREWLYANHYQRGQVTATIGPGGAGKSSVDLVEGLAMATARPLLGEQPTTRCRVWIHNGDDDKAEMDRRIAAVCRHHEIPMAELEGWLFVTTKSDTDIKLGAGNGTVAINRVAVDAIIATILQCQIDVFIAEPLVTLHTVPENDNNKMNQIVHLLSGVADSCDCSIEKPPSARNSVG